MSKRDELAAVLSSATWPDGDASGFPTKRISGMLANAVLAWLGKQLGDEGLLETVANTVPLGWTDRDPYQDVNEAADAALDVVREWFGVSE